MNLSLHQLRVFLKIVEKGSITKAAEELHLTQPAVSIQMKKLQEQFDIRLIEVIGRKLYITDFGKEIAEICERVLAGVDDIRYKTAAYKGQLVGKLKISVVSTAKYAMPYFLAGFLQEHPGIDLVLDVTNKARVVESLESNLVDFVMVSVLPEHLSIDRMELMPNQLFLVGHANAEMDTRKSTLESLPWIYREQGSATRRAMEKFMSMQGLSKRKAMELTSNEAVKQAVLAGLGYSIMPLIGIKDEIASGKLRIIPMPDLPITTHWNLVWLKGKSFTPIAEACLQYIQTHKDLVIAEKFKEGLRT